MKTDFEPGMKVALAGENGVVLSRTKRLHPSAPDSHGFILWDTAAINEIEDWCGLFGSFLHAGGKILAPDFEFQFLGDEPWDPPDRTVPDA